MDLDDEPIAAKFGSELQDLIDKYRDQGVSNGEVIGALEVCKFAIIKDAFDSQESED